MSRININIINITKKLPIAYTILLLTFIFSYNFQFVNASPISFSSIHIHDFKRAGGNTIVYTNSNGLNFTSFNPTLPNVTIFATGKFIAKKKKKKL